MQIKRFTQKEYISILDSHDAITQGLSQSECERFLMEAGATRGQAKNGAYVYLYHRENTISSRRGSREKYDQILNAFDAKTKAPMDCIHYLVSLGFGYRQAQTAIYNYRTRHGLIRQS